MAMNDQTDFLQAPPLLQPAASDASQSSLLEAPPLERPHVAQSTYDALVAGFQESATGLAIRGKLPDIELPENAPWWLHIPAGVTAFAADIPESIAGFLVGSVLGSEVPGIGTAIAGGAGAFAVPMGMRDALIAAYKQPGGPRSWPEVWDIIKAGAIGAVKGAVVGGATGGAGHLAKAGVKAVEPALESALGHVGAEATKFAGEAGAEVGAVGTTSALVQGRVPGASDYEDALLFKVGDRFAGVLPHWIDFQDAAIAVGGYHAAKDVAGRIMNVFRKTGVPPDQVAMDATRDPAIRESLKTSDDLPEAYKPLADAETARAAVPDPQTIDRKTAIEFAQSPFADVPQSEGEPSLPTHINYNYINSTDDAAAALSRLSGLYLDKIQTQRRGSVSWAQTANEARTMLADTLGTTANGIPFDRAAGSPVSAAELFARKQMAVGAAEDLVRQGKALADAGPNASAQQVADFLAAVDRAAMIHSQFLGARAEAGRMLNILKNTSRLAVPLDELQSIVKEHGGADKVHDLARAIAEADSPTAALKAAAEANKPGAMDKLLEVWKASILSGPTTHAANILGNVIASIFSGAERAVAAGIGKFHSGERVEAAEPIALITGAAKGSIDALKLAGRSLIGAGKETEKLDVARPRGAIGTSPDSTKAAQIAGSVIRTPFRALSAEDAFFRQLNESGEAYALATRQATREGFHAGTREFNTRVVDLVQNPSDEMQAAIKLAGDRATFTEKLGPRMQAFQSLVRGSPLEFILPFLRTPTNLLKFAAERVPGVNLLLPSVRADLAAGGARRDMALARMLTGGVVATIAAAAVRDGTLTGGGLAQPDQRAAKRAAGWQPYSIKLDGKYYSYQRLDPAARIVAGVADLMEIYNTAQVDSKADIAAMTAMAIGNSLVSQTYLAGLSEFINALTDPARYGGRWLEGYARSLVPNLVGQTARQLDPQTREVNGLLDAIRAQIPGLREQLLPVRNPLTGQPEPARHGIAPFAPVTESTQSTDPVITEAARLGIHLAAAPRTVHVVRGSGKAGNVKLTPEQRDAFTQAQGSLFHMLMDRIVGSPDWASIPDAMKIEIYQNQIRAARQHASLLALTPAQRMEAARGVIQEQAGQ